MKSLKIKLGTFFVLFLLAFFARAADFLRYEITREWPHDPTHFTQGLVMHEGRLFESTGLYGSSALYEKSLEPLGVLRTHRNASDVFAEGLSAHGKRLYQLSWKNGIGFIYDFALKPRGQFRYEGEGWGLTSDGRSLILSDGSDQLRWLDAKRFAVTRRLSVTHQGKPVQLLNELEYANGKIWANVWTTPFVVRIDPQSGAVDGLLDLRPLRARLKVPESWDEAENVANGLAFDVRNGRFLVTGKRWPSLFEIQLQQ